MSRVCTSDARRTAAVLLMSLAVGSPVAAQPDDSDALSASVESLLDLRIADPVVRQQFDAALEKLRAASAATEGSVPEAIRLADAYGEVGRLLHAYSVRETAETFYRRAHENAPTDYRWSYYLAVVLEQAGRLEEAIDLLQSALVLEPQRHAARLRLATLYLETDRPELGSALLLQGATEHPGCRRAREYLATAALDNGAFDEAASMLEALLEENPEAKHLHYPLGLAYRGLGDLERAREHLGKAIEIPTLSCDPLMASLAELARSETHHVHQGGSYLKSGRFEAAEGSFRKALDRNPESPSAWSNLGAALVGQKRFEEAREAFLEAVRLDPNSASAYQGLGRVSEQRGDPEGAEAYLRRALALDATDWKTSLLLGHLLLFHGRPEESLAHFEAVRQANASIPLSWSGAAIALLSLDRDEEALALLSQARQLLPEDRTLGLLLARLLAAAPDQALRDGSRAHRLAVELQQEAGEASFANAIQLETMALALAELGRCPEAAEWQRDALSVAQFNGSTRLVERAHRILRQIEQGPPCRPAFEDLASLFPGFAENLDSADLDVELESLRLESAAAPQSPPPDDD